MILTKIDPLSMRRGVGLRENVLQWADIFLQSRRYEASNECRNCVRSEDKGPKWVEMPSISDQSSASIGPGEPYHDLGMKFPHAPVPRTQGDVIVHRALLEDVTGIAQLMDWISDGDIVIVEMTDLMSRDMELQLAVGRIQEFVEGDMRGQLVRLGNARLLLLPPTFDSARVK